MKAKPNRPWWLPVVLVGFLLATLASLGGAVVVQWWFTPIAPLAPIVERSYFPDGALMAENWKQRDGHGSMRTIKSSFYYPNGQKAFEGETSGKVRKHRGWLPNGEESSKEEVKRAWVNELQRMYPDRPLNP